MTAREESVSLSGSHSCFIIVSECMNIFCNMKKEILFLVLLSLAVWSSAMPGRKIAGKNVSEFAVVYHAAAEPEEGKTLADSLSVSLSRLAGKPLAVVSSRDAGSYRRTISFVHSPGMKTFDYAVSMVGGNMVIDGGGCWAMQKAADLVVAQLAKGNIPSNYRLKGTVEGKILFPRRPDVNLRILDDNVWNYRHDTIPDEWKRAGADCRDDYRVPQYTQLVRAYMPDVLTFQEYNSHMHERLYPRLQQYGYAMATAPDAKPWVWTPILYDTRTVQLVDAYNILYTPSKWSDQNSKSLTVAVMKHKATGKTFAVLNTHLWWQGDTRAPGSTQARASQIRLMMAEAEMIKAKYDCTIFVTGDMNCEESTPGMQQFIQGGYVPCYKAATLYGNRDNGHHICAPREVGIRQSRRRGADREVGAIDHCLIYNARQGAEVKIFDCIQAAFTVKLTDHYPNLIDAKL